MQNCNHGQESHFRRPLARSAGVPRLADCRHLRRGRSSVRRVLAGFAIAMPILLVHALIFGAPATYLSAARFACCLSWTHHLTDTLLLLPWDHQVWILLQVSGCFLRMQCCCFLPFDLLLITQSMHASQPQPLEGCFSFIRDITNFLEKIVTWPRDCGKAIGDCSTSCPTPL